MSPRQRYYTPYIPDEQYDKMLAALRNEWGILNDSVLISRAITEAYKRIKRNKS